MQEVRIGEVCQVNLMGNIQISTQAVQSLCESGVPVTYFSMGSYFYGITTGLNTKNVALRRSQFRLADSERFSLELAQKLVAGKIRNQRTMMQRNHVEPRKMALGAMKAAAERAERAESLEVLLGIEGSAARVYFEDFAGAGISPNSASSQARATASSASEISAVSTGTRLLVEHNDLIAFIPVLARKLLIGLVWSICASLVLGYSWSCARASRGSRGRSLIIE